MQPLYQARNYTAVADALVKALPQPQIPSLVRDSLRQQKEYLRQLGSVPAAVLLDNVLLQRRQSERKMEGVSKGYQGVNLALSSAPPSPHSRVDSTAHECSSTKGWFNGVVSGLKKVVMPIMKAGAEERCIGVENTFYYNYEKGRWEERGQLFPLVRNNCL